jgi:hypothetical protein
MNTKALFWAVVCGFATVLLGATARAAQEQGNIIARGVKGTVTAREKSADPSVNPVTVTNNMPLRQGMTVTTGVNASVVLIFANGATVNLGTDSSLDIDEFTMEPGATPIDPATITEEPNVSQTKINLTKGELVGKVAKLNKAGGSNFTVSTPVGAAGIRGTTFRIVYRPNGTGQAFFSLTTVEGNVEVTLATGNAPAPVSVTDAQEVVLASVTVNVDNTTGAVTIVLPAGTNVATQAATVATTQAVLAMVQTIVESTANITLSTQGPAVVVETPPPQNPTPPANNPTPPVTQQQQKTTSGDGR